MSERERSRSPDGGAPRSEGRPQDNGGGDSRPNDNGDDAEGIKLYVGNLDYGMYISLMSSVIIQRNTLAHR